MLYNLILNNTLLGIYDNIEILVSSFLDKLIDNYSNQLKYKNVNEIELNVICYQNNSK